MADEFYTGSIPDDIFDSAIADVTPAAEPAAVEAPAEDPVEESIFDEPVDTGDIEEPADDTADPVAETDAAPEPVEAEGAQDEIPEGVTVRDRNGRKEWVYPADRAKSIYDGYKVAKEAEEVLGEPLSRDVLATRQQAHEWMENQRVDALSPDPKEQSYVFRNIFRDAADAIKNGEIAHDPLETMGESFLTTLKEVAPEHYAATAKFVMADQMGSLYKAAQQKALETGDSKLLNTVQNLDYYLTGKYKTGEDLASQKADPIAEREERLMQREQAINNHAAQQKQRQYTAWHQGTQDSIGSAVQGVIANHIPAPVRAAFDAMPNGAMRIENISKLLDLEVKNALKSDPNWATQNANLFRKAQMAPTEESRNAIKQQIVQRYEQKVRQILPAKAKQIIDAESSVVAKTNAATREKSRAAAQQKGVPGTSTPAPRSLPNQLSPNMSWSEFVDSV